MKSSGLRKPPLPLPAVSPRRLRPSRALRSDASCRLPPASCQNNTQLSDQQQQRQIVLEETELCPAYQTIAVELHKLARRVEEQFGRSPDSTIPVASQLSHLNRRSPLFERGRHYQEYAARRNDRLRRRRNGETTVTNRGRDLGVVLVGSETTTKKKITTKRSNNSLRKSMPVEFSVGRSSSSTYNLRSSLRSSKETMKKKPLLPPAYAGTSLDYDVLDLDKKREHHQQLDQEN